MTEVKNSQSQEAREQPEGRVAFWLEWVNKNLENPIQIAQALAKKEKQADYDSMTGILRYDGLKRRLPEYASRLKREDWVSVIIFMDLNDLKKTNDTKGYDAGDRVILNLVAATRQNLRSNDLFGRWREGDEFLILLENSTREGGQNIVERIRKTLPQNISFCAGIAEWSKTDDFDKAIKEAELQMKEEKIKKNIKR